MLKDIEAGKYDGILAWHPDHLARNLLEAGIIVDMVDSGKIKDLKFPTLEFTNDSSGKLLLNIMFAMSKQYSEHLSESVQRGVDSNLAQGKSGGVPKWGYNRDEINNKIFGPDQVQEILDELTNQLDSLAGKMTSGDFWQKDQLARNLFTNLEINNKNEVYYRVKTS